MTNEFVVHTDGGARGNPGPAAIGVVIEKNGKVIGQFGKNIGKTTNNVAEYTAVLEALRYIKKSRGVGTIRFFLDSNLVVQQLNGLFKIKDMKLRELSFKIKILEQDLSALPAGRQAARQGIRGVITYQLIPREQNTQADLLVNQALDQHISS